MASCCFCGRKADHWPSTCSVYDTAHKRTQCALQLQFCLLCLKRGHRIGNPSCRAMPNPCRFCNANIHHKALCDKYIPYNKRRTKLKLRKQKNRRNRQQGGTPSSQPERAGAIPQPEEGPRTGRPAGTSVEGGPGAGRRANGGGPTAARYAHQRPGLATNAASTSLEESTDGSMKPSTATTDVPDSSSGHRTAAPAEKDAYSHWTMEAHQPLDSSEGTGSIGHDSHAPTEPDTDEEDYDADDRARLEGVGTFAAAVPSGAELCRTHLLECVIAEIFNPDDHTRSKTATVFFDSGSSKTFVSEDVAADLGLINLGEQQLTLDTFANDEPVKLNTFRTKLGLMTTGKERLVLDAAASPKIVRQLRTAFITPEDVPCFATTDAHSSRNTLRPTS